MLLNVLSFKIFINFVSYSVKSCLYDLLVFLLGFGLLILLICKSSLYIFKNDTLPVICYMNIFSKFGANLFT